MAIVPALEFFHVLFLTYAIMAVLSSKCSERNCYSIWLHVFRRKRKRDSVSVNLNGAEIRHSCHFFNFTRMHECCLPSLATCHAASIEISIAVVKINLLKSTVVLLRCVSNTAG